MLQKHKIRFISLVILVLSLAGLADSSYLGFKRLRNEVPPCSIVSGCEVVTTSVYSTFLGIPIGFFGSAYYFTVLILILLYLDLGRPLFLKLIFAISGLGFLISIGLLGIQVFILRAICAYCIGSIITTTAIFASSGYFIKAKLHENTKNVL